MSNDERPPSPGHNLHLTRTLAAALPFIAALSANEIAAIDAFESSNGYRPRRSGPAPEKYPGQRTAYLTGAHRPSSKKDHSP